MCNCINVKPGSYDNEISVEIPKHVRLKYNSPKGDFRKTVCIDLCILDEIRSLWDKGIITTGCCCGHNVNGLASIVVAKESVSKMVELGYLRWVNPTDINRTDGFVPKSV